MTATRVLVAYGSTRHGTEGIAEAIGETLRGRGFVADVHPAADAPDPASYDAVVVGGALYAMRWHRDARRYVRRNLRTLRDRPVWLFSSGPLDASAEEKAIPPVRTVARLARRVGARGHETFGGLLAPDASGWIAQKMVEGGTVGDFRDFPHVRTWADGIADALAAAPTVRSGGDTRVSG